jgi:hypothetical protein
MPELKEEFVVPAIIKFVDIKDSKGFIQHLDVRSRPEY